ncbi:cobalt-precorrin-5B (C(1))-methyltransferase CbiD [Mediterraneibacter faecis]|uniref:cobalt-precorrin-5B (C(1))-methyltransferase CbiD n=1 Tax=Mediterraneibacter faecis TaxID=592978 RepID=UPI0032C101D6
MKEIGRTRSGLQMGYTTGSCAAAAAKAAAEMLLSGEEIRQVRLLTPKGIELYLELEEIMRKKSEVSCAVRKYSGDDPDVTNGILVYATVQKVEKSKINSENSVDLSEKINLDGGIGIGRVTKPGLEQKIGQAAINKVPRRMICEAVEEVCRKYEYTGNLQVRLSVPEGAEVAKKTFNPRLGIEGGISILGTTGIVEPMSEKALTDTIYLEMKMLKENGTDWCYVVPGNYGMDFLRKKLHVDTAFSVKCSNYVGETIEDAKLLGMKGILLIGHIGKFIKLAAGVMNTHSRQADCRMEVVGVHAAMNGADAAVVREIMDCINTTEAMEILRREKLIEPVMESVMKRIEFFLKNRAGEELEIGVILFSTEDGILGKSENADELLKKIQENR